MSDEAKQTFSVFESDLKKKKPKKLAQLARDGAA